MTKDGEGFLGHTLVFAMVDMADGDSVFCSCVQPDDDVDTDCDTFSRGEWTPAPGHPFCIRLVSSLPETMCKRLSEAIIDAISHERMTDRDIPSMPVEHARRILQAVAARNMEGVAREIGLLGIGTGPDAESVAIGKAVVTIIKTGGD